MNTVPSNDRLTRLHAARNLLLKEKGNIWSPPHPVKIIVTWWALRLLKRVENWVHRLLRSSNPREPWSSAWFFYDRDGKGIHIRWLGSNAVGSRVDKIIGLSTDPHAPIVEAIEAMIVSLQYPALNPDQVKEWHRDLLGQHGYIDPMNTYTFTYGDDGNISHETRERIWESKEPLTFDQFWTPDQQIFNSFLLYFSLGSCVEAAYRNRDFFIRFLGEHPELDSSICNIIAQKSHTDPVYHGYEQRVIYKAYRLMLGNTGMTNGDLFR